MIDIILKEGDIFRYSTGEYEDTYETYLTCLKPFSTLSLYKKHIKEQFVKYDLEDDPEGIYFYQYIDLFAYMHENGYVKASISTELYMYEEECPNLRKLGLSKEDFINKAKEQKEKKL